MRTPRNHEPAETPQAELNEIESPSLMDDPKTVGDVLSMGTAIGTVAGWMPYFAAALSIVWTAIRIYETKTVQGWLRKRRKK